jgi:hypothetical protein
MKVLIVSEFITLNKRFNHAESGLDMVDAACDSRIVVILQF